MDDLQDLIKEFKEKLSNFRKAADSAICALDEADELAEEIQKLFKKNHG